MNRRAAIRNFVVFSAGVALIPSCMQPEKSKPSVTLKNIPLTGEQEKMLAALTEAILPKTNTPGASDLASHLFVLKMVDDCYERTDREKFVKGMKDFEAFTDGQFKVSFPECTAVQKKSIIDSLEPSTGFDAKKIILGHVKGAKEPGDAGYFYAEVKKLTVQSFVTSKYYLMDVRKFEMAPGRYHGCVPVSQKA